MKNKSTFFENLKINWAESLILAIFLIALALLFVTSSVGSYR